ncbi:MAG: aminoacyl-tRNA hydrolase [Methylococcaceae bacterium]
MIKLIVGLGNPGLQYEKTRHNVGFLFLDRLASDANCGWVKEARFDGLLAEIAITGVRLMLLKPDTFMNRSGQSVGKVARYYKLLPEEILVIHDELDFDVGVVRLKKDGGHAGHNGLRDIIAHLGSRDFYRLRIGIGRPPSGVKVADFVLSSASKSERDLILTAADFVAGYAERIVTGDISAVMSKLNSQ